MSFAKQFTKTLTTSNPSTNQLLQLLLFFTQLDKLNTQTITDIQQIIALQQPLS
jgi:hypothetical protein